MKSADYASSQYNRYHSIAYLVGHLMFYVQKRFAGRGGNRIGLRQGCHFLNLVSDFIFEPRLAALYSWGTAKRSCIKTMLRWAVLGAISIEKQFLLMPSLLPSFNGSYLFFVHFAPGPRPTHSTIFPF